MSELINTKTPCGSTDTSSYRRPHMGQGRRAEIPQSGACTLDQKITSELAPKQEKQDFGEEVKMDDSSNNHLENGTNAPDRQSEIQDNKDSLVAEPLCNYSSHELIKGRSYVSRLRSI